jgi:hypothetical protein
VHLRWQILDEKLWDAVIILPDNRDKIRAMRFLTDMDV